MKEQLIILSYVFLLMFLRSKTSHEYDDLVIFNEAE